MISALEERDLEGAAALLAQEGWTFTSRELARVLATGPGLSVKAEGGGALTGMVMVARHGALAWIGNVVVAPDQRGQGLGEGLVQAALARIDAAGLGTTKLCSVPKAQTLYARLGFRPEGDVHTWGKFHDRPTRRPVEAEVLLPHHLAELAALDRRAFGADRRALLELLLRDYPDTGVGVREADKLVGYAFLKHGAEGSELGPMVMGEPSPALAAQLLDGALGFRLQGGAASIECTMPADHPWMAWLLEDRGFAYRDPKHRMVRGQALDQDWLACALLGGLEKG
ncbi:MAG TPA: GNAT family N-acetyltransferase [Candidatus Thermoplasmatota archaeon]|jgi:predicted N-acetyltransferase YhbS|nr:GNAT family N-acetyltransferase [Candidatus Thermoplasmatota archaeon]